MIDGKTKIVPHIGFPTESFRAPMIYNPWFAAKSINAVVVPFGVRADAYPAFLRAIFQTTNVVGALVTMPHKITTATLVDDPLVAVRIAGSCNAVRVLPDGRLQGDMFDGVGFVRGIQRKGFCCDGARCLVVGAGGVGSAIAGSLAAAGVASIALNDARADVAAALADRLREHYPTIDVHMAGNDPAGYDLVVNGTPLGMQAGDALPFDVTRLAPTTFVGEVVMKQEITPLLAAARERGCRYQVGTDMLFEMIPAYLEFFGFGTTTPDELRAVAQIRY